MRDSLYATVKSALKPCIDMVVSDLLPGGRVMGKEYVCGSVSGGPGKSCKTNLKTGVGQDFATGEKWGDPIALAALVKGCGQKEAALYLAELYGIDVAKSNTTAATKPRKRRTTAAKMETPAATPVMPIPDSAPVFPERYPHTIHSDPARRRRDTRAWRGRAALRL